MGAKEERREDAEKNGGHIKELIEKKYVVDISDEEDFVFISYSSSDWKEVLYEIVYNTCKKYGLRVYFDTKFDVGSKSWLSQFRENMQSEHCKAVLAFISPNYKSSYATLMELMASQGTDMKKAVLPVVIGNSEVNNRENNGLGTSRFSDNSTNDLWENELDLFNTLFKGLLYDRESRIFEDKDYIKSVLYLRSEDSKIPYREALKFEALKRNDAYWKNKSIYTDEEKEKHWASMKDKGSSGELYLTKERNAKLVSEILKNIDKNNIDGVNKDISDAIKSKLDYMGFGSVFSEKLVEDPLKSDTDSNSRKSPISKEINDLPSGRVGHLTTRTGAYDAYYRMNVDGTFTILKDSKVNINDFTPPSVLKENKDKIVQGVLLDDINIDTRSTAERFIKGYKAASGQSLIDNLIDNGGDTANDKKKDVQPVEQADHTVVEPTTDIDFDGLYRYSLDDVLKRYSVQTFKASDVSTIGLQIQGRPEYSIGQCKNINELLRAVVDVSLDKQGEDYIKLVNKLNEGQKNPVFVKYSDYVGKKYGNIQYSKLEKFPDWVMNVHHCPYDGLRKVGARLKEQGISLSDVTIILGNELKEVDSVCFRKKVSINENK